LQRAVQRTLGIVLQANGYAPAVPADPLGSYALSVRRFPSAAYEVSVLSSAFFYIVPMYLTLIFSFQVRVLLTRILEEKERKVYSTLLAMGVSQPAWWSSWVATALVRNTLVVALVALLLCVAGVFPRSNFGVVFLFFFLFEVNCIVFCTVMTPFFSKSRSGGALGMIIYAALALPSYAITATRSVPFVGKILLSFLSPTAYHLGVTVIMKSETLRIGVHGHNLRDRDLTPLGVSLADLMAMLSGNIVIYGLLAWYASQVAKSEFGVSRHPLFCLGFRRATDTTAGQRLVQQARTNDVGAIIDRYAKKRGKVATALSSLRHKIAGCRRGKTAGATTGVELSAPTVPTPPSAAPQPHSDGGRVAETDFEPFTPDVSSRSGVHIRNLCKVFPSFDSRGPQLAVDGLTLSMYENTVTVLLGHNSAGKSTTISMLSGLYSPSMGDAEVYGHSIVNDPSQARSITGVCPQEDILFEQLSVRDHLVMYGAIKGLRGEKLTAEIDSLLADLGLEDKARTWAGKLSGGQKRRLGVAIAFIGGSKFIMLDEISSGLDPASRRQVWNVIQKNKTGRVICVVTHFMDEADILGDRIALMARGKLRVCGSPLFLKTHFGVGYTLTATISTRPGQQLQLSTPGSTFADALAFAEVDMTMKLVHQFVPDATIASCLCLPGTKEQADSMVGPTVELKVTLPTRFLDRFPLLFEALEKQKQGANTPGGTAGHVTDFSVSMTSMDDVFLRLAAVVEAEEETLRSQHPVASSAAALNADDKPVTVPVHDAGTGKAAWAWWLDSKRRFLYQPSADTEKADLADYKRTVLSSLPPANNTYTRGTWRFFVYQTKWQLWRRWLQVARDPRSIWLQTVTPIIFLAIGTISRLLKGVGQPEYPTATSTTWDAIPSSDQWSIAGASSASINTSATTLFTHVNNVWDMVEGSPSVFLTGSLQPDQLSRELFGSSDVAGAFYLGSPAVSNTSYTLNLFFNQTFANILPTMLSLWDTALLSSSNASVEFRPVFDPMPPVRFTNTPVIGDYIGATILGFLVAMGFITIPAVQAASSVIERETRAKKMQLLMGSSPANFWLSCWLWDFLLYLFTWAGGSLIIYGVNIGGLFTGRSLGAVIVVLLLYGAAIPGPTYVFAARFTNGPEAQMVIRIGYSILLIAGVAASFLLEYPDFNEDGSRSLVHGARAVHYIFLAFPPYALAKAFMDVGAKARCPASLLAAELQCKLPDPFSWSLAGSKILYLILSIVFWAAVLMYIESHGSKRAPSATLVPANEDNVLVPEDDDVLKEKEALKKIVANPETIAHGIIAQGLRRVFTEAGTGQGDPRARRLRAARGEGGRRRRRRQRKAAEAKVAVADINVAIRENEIFGLLGPNGCGKTTTLSMLVGELAATAGVISVAGRGPEQLRRDLEGLVGFCPQFDALFDYLTGDETLRFFAGINGVPEEHTGPLVDAALESLDLSRHRHKLTRHYSGGNKRRLSLAIAYISCPAAVYLDECSTGVSPDARRRMFDVIRTASRGRSTFLTTHVMEEAELLCSIIGIMVAGRLACYGSPTHLKQKYGSGYTIEVSILPDFQASAAAIAKSAEAAIAPYEERLEHAKALIETHVPGAQLREVNGGHLRFEVPRVTLSAIFRLLNENQIALGVGDYSVTQTTLESVFLRFSFLQQQALAQSKLEAAAL
jgi:ABC-type multidrug transport system ATPase subunit